MDDNALLQAIGKMMDDKLDTRLQPITNRLDTMQGDIQELKNGQTAMQTDICTIKEQISNIDESIGAISEWADITATVTKIPFAGGGTTIT